MLINIWSYSDVNYNSSLSEQYKKWCIQIAKSKWRSERYMNFDFVIKNIEEQNAKLIDLGTCCHDSLLIGTRSEHDRLQCQGKRDPVFNVFYHKVNNQFFYCLNRN